MPENTARFTNRVADYVKARPTYPHAVIDALRERTGLVASAIVADVGSGTGISTRLFLENGNTVFAVEPNAAMRAAAVAQFAGNPRFEAIDGTAEATTLPADSIDLIVAAQAFHWFDRAAFARECRRIGRAGSHLLLMWNERLATGTPFAEGYERLLSEYATDYTRVDHRALTAAQIAEAFAGAPEVIELPNAQVMDFDLLQARLLSSSYAPPANDPRHAPMLAALRDLFDRTAANGQVTMDYRTQLHIGPVHAADHTLPRGTCG